MTNKNSVSDVSRTHDPPHVDVLDTVAQGALWELGYF